MNVEQYLSEIEWMRFGGLLQQCNGGCSNRKCPFSRYKFLDNTQKLHQIQSINETEASKMLKLFNKCEKN